MLKLKSKKEKNVIYKYECILIQYGLQKKTNIRNMGYTYIKKDKYLNSV